MSEQLSKRMNSNVLHDLTHPDCCKDILELVDECNKPWIVNIDGLRVDLPHDARHGGRFLEI